MLTYIERERKKKERKIHREKERRKKENDKKREEVCERVRERECV